MSDQFAAIAFTPSVQAVQESMGVRRQVSGNEGGQTPAALGAEEMDFISRRDSFYLASVSETDWPYVQHRGGPAGFLKVLSATTLGFADYRGNRQYVSVGNLLKNDRVAMILMDYPNRARLKILGHARVVAATETELLDKLRNPQYRAKLERGMLIEVAAYDWNCPQHITPRYTAEEVENAVGPLRLRLAHLEEQLKARRESPSNGPR